MQLFEFNDDSLTDVASAWCLLSMFYHMRLFLKVSIHKVQSFYYAKFGLYLVWF